jgi:RNA polymerase II subunit A small phosphatase-like protein
MNATSDFTSARLLILDIDETLVYGAEGELDRPADFRAGPFHVYQRPHLQDFLQGVAQWYPLAIWSSATIDYVELIAKAICPKSVSWQFVWGRDRCTQRLNPERQEIDYIKDMKKVKRLGYNVNRILFIDDTESKMSRNYGNAIYVSPFVGAADDTELAALLQYLGSIRTLDNYRAIEKRGWRSRLSGC